MDRDTVINILLLFLIFYLLRPLMFGVPTDTFTHSHIRTQSFCTRDTKHFNKVRTSIKTLIRYTEWEGLWSSLYFVFQP